MAPTHRKPSSSGSEYEPMDSPSPQPRHHTARTTPRHNKRQHNGGEAEKMDRRYTEDDLRLLDSGNFSDARVIFKDRVWNVHKTIMCPRSKWFADAYKGTPEASRDRPNAWPSASPPNCGTRKLTPSQDGQTSVVNLTPDPENASDRTEDEINTLIRFIYSGALDPKVWSTRVNPSFKRFVRLFNLGHEYSVTALCDDALALLRDFCDLKLAELCSYDTDKSGRHGVVDIHKHDPTDYIENLIDAIWASYTVQTNTCAQALLCAFVWAGRERLLKEDPYINDYFLKVCEGCPMFGNHMFQISMGVDPSRWLPMSGEQVREVTMGFDHTHKTQHPDRCASCNECFDDKNMKKAMYTPFMVVARPAAYCLHCVKKHDPNDKPFWRERDDESSSLARVKKDLSAATEDVANKIKQEENSSPSPGRLAATPVKRGQKRAREPVVSSSQPSAKKQAGSSARANTGIASSSLGGASASSSNQAAAVPKKRGRPPLSSDASSPPSPAARKTPAAAKKAPGSSKKPAAPSGDDK
ncbi:hypothetical protein B0H63DRAFT_565671 [Podospora didyma]|uniref:BTB domain-containing protein n=1 Tax=Podospora didyma TaxID=330526 RepID=A0AAE0K1N1_9PEZI|nr:hypothetical protein B0H63DRAFT_565671 [Podospora didyma]